MDNCVGRYNPLQEDFDGDGIGDACPIESNIIVSEALTPNYDGANDYWLIKNINDGKEENFSLPCGFCSSF